MADTVTPILSARTLDLKVSGSRNITSFPLTGYTGQQAHPSGRSPVCKQRCRGGDLSPQTQLSAVGMTSLGVGSPLVRSSFRKSSLRMTFFPSELVSPRMLKLFWMARMVFPKGGRWLRYTLKKSGKLILSTISPLSTYSLNLISLNISSI